MQGKWLSVIVLILALLLGVFIWLQRDVEKPAAPPPHPVPAAIESPTKHKEDHGMREQTTLEFSPDPIEAANREQPELDSYAMSLRKQKRDIVIAPEVVYRPREGLMINSDEDEALRIKKDNTYRAGEYRVFWEKKY